MKRDKYDKLFSDVVRARDRYTCTRCGKQYPLGTRGGLHCSHFFGRAKKSVRWDMENADAHCHGCHQYLSSHPHEFREWKYKRLGKGRYHELVRRANGVKKWTPFEKEQLYKELKEKLVFYNDGNYATELGKKENSFDGF